MPPLKTLASWMCLVILAASLARAAAAAPDQTYVYEVEHPQYGNIGTYSDTVEQIGDQRRIDTKVRVAVKVLGIVMFRQEADRSELWRGDHLVSFHSVTVTNGDKIEVTGEAKNGGFLISSPAGTVLAPANVYPSSPWAAAMPQPAMMMSTKTGKLFPVRVADAGQPAIVSLYGSPVEVRHFAFQTDKHQDVWMNRRGIPVRFRTEEDGTPIDFVLNPQQVAELKAQ
ncbi:MAG: hypothetical protein JO010_03505 [Alphaproteobacteria bacterium]|nr:hypothetical protein [Alphaproteobacteria bacterium]